MTQLCKICTILRTWCISYRLAWTEVSLSPWCVLVASGHSSYSELLQRASFMTRKSCVGCDAGDWWASEFPGCWINNLNQDQSWLKTQDQQDLSHVSLWFSLWFSHEKSVIFDRDSTFTLIKHSRAVRKCGIFNGQVFQPWRPTLLDSTMVTWCIYIYIYTVYIYTHTQ